MRQFYINADEACIADQNLLEIFISAVIRRKDVKQISYDLLNKFGSLQNILSASVDELMEVDGVGEVLAVHLSLVKCLHKRVVLRQNDNIQTFDTVNDAVEYCKNYFFGETTEKVIMITLNDLGEVLGCHLLGQGTVNESRVNIRNAVALAIKDNATNVIIAHNHPQSHCSPSATDINMSILFKRLFKDVNITLLEHIIIGTDKECLLFQSDIFQKSGYNVECM